MKSKFALIAILMGGIPGANAGYFQSPVNDARLKDIPVTSEKGTNSRLSRSLKSGKDLILVPAYFTCRSTCPLLAENLRDSVLSAKNREQIEVVFLSFSSDDSAESMRMFRKHHHIPDEWTLLVAKSEADAKDVLSQFGFQFQKTPEGFDHPNSAFVFSKLRRTWSGILVGVDNTPADIERAVGEANDADFSGIAQRFFQIVSKPEYLIVGGFFGILASLFLIFFIIVRRKPKEGFSHVS